MLSNLVDLAARQSSPLNGTINYYVNRAATEAEWLDREERYHCAPNTGTAQTVSTLLSCLVRHAGACGESPRSRDPQSEAGRGRRAAGTVVTTGTSAPAHGLRDARLTRRRPGRLRESRAGGRGWKKPGSALAGQRSPSRTLRLTIRDVNHLCPLFPASVATEGLGPSRPRYLPPRPALGRHSPRVHTTATEKGGGRSPLAAGRGTRMTGGFFFFCFVTPATSGRARAAGQVSGNDVWDDEGKYQ